MQIGFLDFEVSRFFGMHGDLRGTADEASSKLGAGWGPSKKDKHGIPGRKSLGDWKAYYKTLPHLLLKAGGCQY